MARPKFLEIGSWSKKVYKNNLKEGEWIYYTEDADIRKRIFFEWVKQNLLAISD